MAGKAGWYEKRLKENKGVAKEWVTATCLMCGANHEVYLNAGGRVRKHYIHCPKCKNAAARICGD